MNALRILWSLAAGLALGAAFYGGLWLTVRRLMVTRHPFALTMGSLLLRTAGALAAFVWVAGGRLENAIACLAGFVLARLAASKAVSLCA